MSQPPWIKSLDFDLNLISEALTYVVESSPPRPTLDLDPGPLRNARLAEDTLVGEGWDFEAHRVGPWLVRIAKHASGAQTLAKEAAVLAAIREVQPAFGALVPNFVYTLDSPSPFVVYPVLAGCAIRHTSLSATDLDRLAKDAVAFTHALHSIPPDSVRFSLNNPDVDRLAHWRERVLGYAAAGDFEGLRTQDALVNRALKWLENVDIPEPRADRVVAHSDLHPSHVLIDERGELPKISGYIDWGDVEIGHRDADLGALMRWFGAKRITEAAASVGYGTPTLKRAQIHLVCTGFLLHSTQIANEKSEHAAPPTDGKASIADDGWMALRNAAL